MPHTSHACPSPLPLNLLMSWIAGRVFHGPKQEEAVLGSPQAPCPPSKSISNPCRSCCRSARPRHPHTWGCHPTLSSGPSAVDPRTSCPRCDRKSSASCHRTFRFLLARDLVGAALRCAPSRADAVRPILTAARPPSPTRHLFPHPFKGLPPLPALPHQVRLLDRTLRRCTSLPRPRIRREIPHVHVVNRPKLFVGPD